MIDLNNNGNPYDDATLEEALNQIYDRCTDRTIRQVAYSLAKRIQQGESGSAVDAYTKSETNELLSNKVDKEAGKGLSTEDFTTALLNKLSSIEERATRVIVDAIVTALSDNPVKSSGVYDFVNSSIATNTAYYIGTFNSIDDLNSYAGKLSNNDYAFVISTDEEGNTLYNRYKYAVDESDNTEWKFEYALNNSSYTAAQWATINSGITATDKQELYSKINDNIEDISNLQITVASKAEEENVYTKSKTNELLSNKVDKETGKSLSTNDYTTAEKEKLAGIETGANKTTVDTALSSTSTNPIQNKVINTALGKKANSSEVYTKTETDAMIVDVEEESSLTTKVKVMFAMQRTGKIYTVKFPLWATSQTCTGEKLDDNEGLVCNPSTAVTRGVSDYDDIPLFRTYDCNAYVDENDVRYITSIKGDGKFKDTGKVDVFVLGMSYYEKTWIEDGYQYYSRTDMPREGYTLAVECRDKNGNDQGFALYGKYIAGDIDGSPYSSKGLIPARDINNRPSGSQKISYSDSITYFHKRGSHYSGTMACDAKYITTTFWLKYGTRNSQSIMAGYTDCNYGYKATVAETGVKRIIISNTDAATLKVGLPVSVGTGNDKYYWTAYNKIEYATITSIDAYDSSNMAVSIDSSSTFDVTTSTYLNNAIYKSGYSDNVLGRDGCPCLTSGDLTTGKYPMVFQGIEIMAGAVECISNAIADIVDSTGTRNVYTINDTSKLTTDVATIKSTYTKNSSSITVTKLNMNNGITAESIDVVNGIIVPTASGQSGASGSTGFADIIYVDSGTSGQRELLCFGNLTHKSGAGVSCLSVGGTFDGRYWSIATRLSING